MPQRLESARLLLREATLWDAPEIFAGYARDPEVTRFLTFTPHESLSDTRRFLVGAQGQRAAGLANTYAIILRDGGRLVGTFDLRREAMHKVSCGYVLERACWGKGLMTEALSAAMAWVKATQDVTRFWTFCDLENIGSARVMEKAGLTREAVLRKWIFPPNLGEARDIVTYAWIRDPA